MLGKNGQGEVKVLLWALTQSSVVVAVTCSYRVVQAVAREFGQTPEGNDRVVAIPFLGDQKVEVGFPFGAFGAQEFTGVPWENYDVL